MAESLIFRSQGRLFALPSSCIAGLSLQEWLPGVSFAQYFFHSPQDEPHHVILAEGYVLHVQEVVEIQALAEKVSPVPGYIFETGGEWLRGILWYGRESVLVLNDAHLLRDLATYVPEFSI